MMTKGSDQEQAAARGGAIDSPKSCKDAADDCTHSCRLLPLEDNVIVIERGVECLYPVNSQVLLMR